MPRPLLQVCATLLALLPAITEAADQASRLRPSIIVIDADDLGTQLSCYGDRNISTPNLDALAARGQRFSRAYVAQPSCSPSRAALLTGLYPHQSGQIGLSHRGFSMESRWRTLPAVLGEAGYRTGIIGKLHVQPQASFTWDVAASSDVPSKGWPAGSAILTGWPHAPLGGTRDIPRTSAAIGAFIDSCAGSPFFLKVSLLDPHRTDLADGEPYPRTVAGLPLVGIAPDPALLPWVRNPTPRDLTDAAGHYTCTLRVDAALGKLDAILRASGRIDDTIVVFWGDNGPALPKAKTTLSEAGCRVPLIIAGPGIANGTVREELVSMTDLMPTLLELAGLPMPEPNAGIAPGRSLVPLLGGDRAPAAFAREVAVEMTFHTHRMYAPARAMIGKRWKLVRRLLPPGEELYDLDQDPHEHQDRAGDPDASAERSRLSRLLDDWMEATADPLRDPLVVKDWATIPKHPDTPHGPFAPRKEAP